MTQPIAALFVCGRPVEHDCDSDGPMIYGGDDVPITTDVSKAGKGLLVGKRELLRLRNDGDGSSALEG